MSPPTLPPPPAHNAPLPLSYLRSLVLALFCMPYATIQTSFLSSFLSFDRSFIPRTLPHSLIPLTSLKKFSPYFATADASPRQTYSQGRHFLHNIEANSSTTDILAPDKGMLGKDFPSLVITASPLTFKSLFSSLFLFL